MPHKRAKHATRMADREKKGKDAAPPSSSRHDPHFSSLPKGAMSILNAGKIREEFNAKRRAIKQAGGDPSILKELDQDKHRLTAAQKGKGKAKGPSMDKDGNEQATDEKAETADEVIKSLKIRPGEKLGDFNRRVEQVMAGQIASTARSQARKEKKRKRTEAEATRAQEVEEAGGSSALTEATRRKRAAKAGEIASREPTAKELKRQRDQLRIAERGDVDLDFAQVEQSRGLREVAQAPPKLTKLPRGFSTDAQAQKAKVAAAIGGLDPDEAEQMSRRTSGSNRSKTVTAGQMPEPVRKKSSKPSDEATTGNVARQRKRLEMEEERARLVQLYRQRKQDRTSERGGGAEDE